MKLYKESGVKPAGCAITMVIQMPVWIALYQSIMLSLAVAPEGLLNLSRYPLPLVGALLRPAPEQHVFTMNLAAPNFIMAILVGATMWLQQKMSTTTPADPKQAQQAQLMLWMMPMMFTVLALSFPAGLSLYWVTSSVFRIVLQYRVTGWGGLRRKEPASSRGRRNTLSSRPRRRRRKWPAPTSSSRIATPACSSRARPGTSRAVNGRRGTGKSNTVSGRGWVTWKCPETERRFTR